MLSNVRKKSMNFFHKVANVFGLEIHLKKDGYHYVQDIYGYSGRKQLDIRDDKVFRKHADDARRDSRTLMYYDRLYTAYQCLKNILRNKPTDEEFLGLEVGVYRGGLSYFVASVLNDEWGGKKRTFAVDTFEGHSALDIPGGKEGNKQVPGLFGNTSYESVKDYLAKFPFCTVVKARIQDTAQMFEKEKFDFIHLDTDLYLPTKFALDFFIPRMKTGGIILLDDYQVTTTPGIERAIHESGADFYRFHPLSPQCILLKARI